MEAHELVIYGVVCFVANAFGGIAGGGAGFITTPLLIFLGLSPAQAISSGKFAGLAVTAASLQRLQKEKLHSKKIIVPIMLLATVIGLLSPLAILELDSEFYRKALGILLLVMVPFVLLKKVGYHRTNVGNGRKFAGWVLLTVALFLQAVFSSGMGTLVNLTLMGMMGMSALEASVTKRFSQILLNTLIVFGVLFSGVIAWDAAVVGTISAFLGGMIGVRIAIKKGDRFVSYVFVAFMLLAAVGLLLD